MAISNLIFLWAVAMQTVPVTAPPPPPSVPATMPGEVLAAFAGAEAALAKVSACVGDGATVTPQRLATLDRRLMALRRQANGVWGAEALQTLASATSISSDCQRDGGAAALGTAAELQLTQLTAKLSGVLAPMRTGVWFGTMPLCGRGPVTAQKMVDVYTADPFLIITLDPVAAADLAALTGRHVGHPLAFRAAARVISEPQINEPITGGQLQLSGPPQSELDRVAAAIKGCAR
jgi:hypothetical protein